ncbi:GntR family transcriptional regulator [Mycolicibacterium murale]|uniref:GntR family transcriptional regulator n=1 Tax=Mycolicibacterium murale TaxID=182220 RepID=UPI001C659157|nr:GntR family transcriptional regulator [Mycolicibacterium murale]MCV7180413.1 GntR family transcriptional regulator [Mycolicibacterium murale]
MADLAQERVLRSIIGGEYADGRLPPEDQLARQLGVSRTTIRAALQGLERAGLVTRRQGTGTVVNQHVDPASLGLQRLAGFEDLLQESGYRTDVRILTDYVPADPALAAQLGVRVGDDCLVTTKTFLADGKPAVFVTDAIASAALQTRPSPHRAVQNLYELLDRHHSMRLDHSVVEIRPRAAEGDICKHLDLPPGTPLLLLIESHYTFEGNRMGSSVAEINDQYLQFSVIRR